MTNFQFYMILGCLFMIIALMTRDFKSNIPFNIWIAVSLLNFIAALIYNVVEFFK